jgi:hypothetical protein
MPVAVESRVTVSLTLDPTHWRRHDRAHWAQTLALAANEAAPDVMQVGAYEMQDALVVLRLNAKLPARQMHKLWRDDERFLRLRSRFVDLGARADIAIEEIGA